MTEPAQVGEHYVLGLLQLSSCFRGEVCHSKPCACAQSLLDEIGKPLRAESERLRAAVDLAHDDVERLCVDIANQNSEIQWLRRALENKP